MNTTQQQQQQEEEENVSDRQDIFAPFESQPQLADDFICHVLRTNLDNSTLTANMSAVGDGGVCWRLFASGFAQILARADKENLGTLLKNLVQTQHMELSRGVFAWLRAKGRLSSAKRFKVEDGAGVAPVPDLVRHGEFNDEGEMVDARGNIIMMREKIHNRFIYTHCGTRDLNHIDLSDDYTGIDDRAPDRWCGDYFLNSEEAPILFRCRGVADPAGVVKYHHVEPVDRLGALLRRDEAEYLRLFDEEAERIREEADESEDECVKAENEDFNEVEARLPRIVSDALDGFERERREAVRASKLTNARVGRRVVAPKPQSPPSMSAEPVDALAAVRRSSSRIKQQQQQ